MNFLYLKNQTEFELLYSTCREAEEFALTKPDVSALSARRAMEWIVKYIYAQVESNPPYGCTVYDMTQDERFRNLFADPAMLESIDLIRKCGNAAAHRGSLSAENTVWILEQLHYLVGEFAVGIGLIDTYAPFVKPDPLKEALNRVHPDNMKINLLPYLRADSHIDWATAMIRMRKRYLEDLYSAPSVLNQPDFIEYLAKFERSMKAEAEALLQLLPLAPATQSKWATRRGNVSKEAIDKIELYMQAYIEDLPRGWNKHTYYVQALGERAMAYLWLAHPDYVPESMQGAYVVPDGNEIANDDEYISLENAVKQLLKYYAIENMRRCDLLSKRDWCKMHIGTPLAVLTNTRAAEHREMYSEERIHIGSKKYAVYLRWDKKALLRLRQLTGELGEKIVTMDRMADWGFATPGSEAEKRAKLRAEKRAEEKRLHAEAEAMERKTEKPAQKIIETPDPEFSPRELRSYLQMNLNLLRCRSELCSPEWSLKYFGFKHPILIEREKGLYLRRKQMDGNYTYSLLQMQYAGKSYLIHRMKTSEFERLKKFAEKMEWTNMKLGW